MARKLWQDIFFTRGINHVKSSWTRVTRRRHNIYVMRGFLYWLAVHHGDRLLAVSGFGRVADRLNFFVSGTLRISRLHRGQMRIILIWKLPLSLHYWGLTGRAK